MAANMEKRKDASAIQGATPNVLKARLNESQHFTQRGTVSEGQDRGRTGTTPKTALDPFELFLVKPTAAKLTKPGGGVEQTRQGRFWFTQSYLCGVTKKDQLGKMRHFERKVLGTQDLRDSSFVSASKDAKEYERKLEKELKKLSDQSRPSRERVRLFSDVFDDVCKGSTGLGDILREIKTVYDLYLNSLLATQSSLDSMSTLDDLGIIGAEDLEEAGNEVSKLEEEARRALEENDRVREEMQNAHDRFPPGDEGPHQEFTLPRLTRSGEDMSIDRVQSMRCQVWTVLEALQLMQKEIQEKMVSIMTTESTQSCIRNAKGAIMKLQASNECFRNTSEDLEHNINMILNRSRSSKDEKAEVWNKIWSALKTNDERTQQTLLS